MGSHYWYYLVLSTVCVYILSQIVQVDSLDMEDLTNLKKTKKLCGKNLADTLQLACDGAYNAMYKKSENDQDYLYQSDQEDPTPYEFAQQPFPFRSRIAASSMYPRQFRRFTRGIINECCKKPCSLTELKTYCAY